MGLGSYTLHSLFDTLSSRVCLKAYLLYGITFDFFLSGEILHKTKKNKNKCFIYDFFIFLNFIYIFKKIKIIAKN